MAEDPIAPISTPKRARKRRPKHRTWVHPVGSGIKIAEMPNRTAGKVYGVSFQVRIPAGLVGGENREMHQRKTRAEAERLAEDRYIALKKHGTEFSKIPAEVQREAAIAWSKLETHNDGLRKQALAKNGGVLPADFRHHELTLLAVVEAGIRHLSPPGGLRSFADVCAELRASKAERLKAGGLDASTERDFRNRSARLEAEFGAVLINEITADGITEVLGKLRAAGLEQRTVLNFRNTLAEVVRYAKAKQYIANSPLDRFTREDYKKLGGEKAERNLDAINILSLEETRKLLTAAREFCDTSLLATTILRLFCGLRTGEVAKLDWKEVHWLDPKPYVHIPQNKAKKRRIRHVDIPENALAWLKLCNPPAAGRIDPRSPKQYTRRFAKIAKRAGIGGLTDVGDWESEWENNDTRHSFGSYHYAAHGDAMKTAKLLGHKQNDEVLFAHYRALVTEDQGKEYFAIFPPAGTGNVTAFPRGATG